MFRGAPPIVWSWRVSVLSRRGTCGASVSFSRVLFRAPARFARAIAHVERLRKLYIILLAPPRLRLGGASLARTGASGFAECASRASHQRRTISPEKALALLINEKNRTAVSFFLTSGFFCRQARGRQGRAGAKLQPY